MEDEPPAPFAHLWVIGAGRVGLALGLLLRETGAAKRLTYSGRSPLPPVHPLFGGEAPAGYRADLHPPAPSPDIVLIAVPDREIAGAARRLVTEELAAGTPVLHTSGALGAAALAPLAERGCPTGSLHPLVAVADPVGGAERLRGAWFALEGHPAAIRAARAVVAAADGRVLPLEPGAKAEYHAAAVLASNYVVALLGVAERLLGEAGAPPVEARAALAALARGAVDDVARGGPEAALTGPVARGDHDTVATHLARLSPSDRVLYSVLARETLALARRRGMDAAAAERLAQLLGENA